MSGSGVACGKIGWDASDVSTVSFSPCGSNVVTGSQNRSAVFVYGTTEDFKTSRIETECKDGVSQVCASKNAEIICAADNSKPRIVILRWNSKIKSYEKQISAICLTKTRATGCAIDEQGKYLTAAFSGGDAVGSELMVFEIEEKKIPKVIKEKEEVSGLSSGRVAMSADGDQIAWAVGKKVKLMRRRSGGPRYSVTLRTTLPPAVSMARDGSSIIACGVSENGDDESFSNTEVCVLSLKAEKSEPSDRRYENNRILNATPHGTTVAVNVFAACGKAIGDGRNTLLISNHSSMINGKILGLGEGVGLISRAVDIIDRDNGTALIAKAYQPHGFTIYELRKTNEDKNTDVDTKIDAKPGVDAVIGSDDESGNEASTGDEANTGDGAHYEDTTNTGAIGDSIDSAKDSLEPPSESLPPLKKEENSGEEKKLATSKKSSCCKPKPVEGVNLPTESKPAAEAQVYGYATVAAEEQAAGEAKAAKDEKAAENAKEAEKAPAAKDEIAGAKSQAIEDAEPAAKAEASEDAKDVAEAQEAEEAKTPAGAPEAEDVKPAAKAQAIEEAKDAAESQDSEGKKSDGDLKLGGKKKGSCCCRKKPKHDDSAAINFIVEAKSADAEVAVEVHLNEDSKISARLQAEEDAKICARSQAEEDAKAALQEQIAEDAKTARE